MSEVHQNENQDDSNSVNEEFVSKQAYVAVSKDMHTYKQKMKELTAQLEAIKADNEAREVSVLQEQEKWHDLYKKSETKIQELQSIRDQERNKFLEGHKKNSVLQNVSFKKPDYIRFIDVSKIEVNEDGSISPESVQLEVDRIKKEYPELLKTSAKEMLPDAAPKGAAAKAYNEMTSDERDKERMRLILEKQKQKK